VDFRDDTHQHLLPKLRIVIPAPEQGATAVWQAEKDLHRQDTKITKSHTSACERTALTGVVGNEALFIGLRLL